MAAPWPDHLLTLEEFDALPEDNTRRYELEEGVLLVTPIAIPHHAKVARRLSNAIEEQAPYEWEVFENAEVKLSATSPSVRIPDLVVVAEDPSNDTVARFDANQVLIAVEVVSRGSRVTDTVTKPSVYATAGIPHYWVIDDIHGDVSLTAYRLGDGSVYRVASPATKRFTTTEPFPLDIDLTTLTMTRRQLDGTVDS